MIAKLIAFALLIVTFYSCDPIFIAEIKNKKPEDVIIKVGFDKAELKDLLQDRSYIDFLRSYPNWTDIEPAIDFDTVNLILTFKVMSDQSFPLKSGIGGHVDLSLIESLSIISSDTINYENIEQIKDAFNVKKSRHWIMEID